MNANESPQLSKREDVENIILHKEKVFEHIADNFSHLDEYDRKTVLLRVFEYSADDGFILADKLNLLRSDIVDIITSPTFVEKHRLLMKSLRHQLSIYSSFLTPPDYENLGKIMNLGEVLNDDDKFDEFVERNASLKKQKITAGSKPVVDLIDGYYLNFIKNLSPEEGVEKGDDPSQVMFDVFMRQFKFARKKFFYTGDVQDKIMNLLSVDEEGLIDLLKKKKVGKKVIENFMSSQFLSAEDIEIISLKLEIDKTVLESTRKKPYSEFYYAVKDATKKEIRDELSRKLEDKYGIGRADVVENESGELVIEAREVDDDEKKDTVIDVKFEMETQDFIEKYIKLKIKEVDENLSKVPPKFEYAFSASVELFEKYDHFDKLQEVFLVFLNSPIYNDRYSSSGINPLKILGLMRKKIDLDNETIDKFIDALSQSENRGIRDFSFDATITSIAENRIDKFEELIKLNILNGDLESWDIEKALSHIQSLENPKIFFDKLIDILKKTEDKFININEKDLDILVQHDKTILDHFVNLEIDLDSRMFNEINYFIKHSNDTEAIDSVIERVKEKGDEKYFKFICTLKEENLVRIHKYIPDFVDLLLTKANEKISSLLNKMSVDPILFKDSIDKILSFYESKNDPLQTIDYLLSIKDYDKVYEIFKNELEGFDKSNTFWNLVDSRYNIDKIGGDKFKDVDVENIKAEKDNFRNFERSIEYLLKIDINNVPDKIKVLMKDIAIFLSKTIGTEYSVKLAILLNDDSLKRELLNNANYRSAGYNRYYNIFNEFKLSATLKDYKYFEDALVRVVKSDHTNSLEYLDRSFLKECDYDPKIIEIILRTYYDHGYKTSLAYFFDNKGLNKDNLSKSKDFYLLQCKYYLLDGLSEIENKYNSKYNTLMIIRFATSMEDIDMLKKVFYMIKDLDGYDHYAKECLEGINKLQSNEKKNVDIGESEQSYIDMYKVVNNPSDLDLERWQKGQSSDKNKSGKRSFSYFVKKMITESPKILFGNITAKVDETSPKKMNLLLIRLFPDILLNKQKVEREDARGGVIGQLFGKNYELDNVKDVGNSPKNNYLQENSSTLMWGGDPRYAEKELSKVEVIKTSEAVFAFQASECFLSLENTGGSRWGKIPLKISHDNAEGVGNDIEVKIKELLYVKGKIVILKPLLSSVDISSIQAFDRDGKPVNITVQEKIDGTITVDLGDNGNIESLTYKYKVIDSSIDIDVTDEEFDQFKDRLSDNVKAGSRNIFESKVALPAEVQLFIDSIKDLTPIDKVTEIERYVREISYYDFDNGEVQKDKFGRSPNELFTIMQFRMEDLKKKKKELAGQLSGKMFAGVCADFANLTALIFRSAGIPSGVSTGFLQSGDKVTLADAHGLCIVPWPTRGGDVEFIEVDGTPGGITDEEKEKLKRFRLPDLESRLKNMGKNKQEFGAELSKRLLNLEKIIQSGDIEMIKRINIKELSSIIDSIFANENGNYHVQMIENILSAVRYSPLNKLIFSEDTKDRSRLKSFVEMHIDIFNQRFNKKEQQGKKFDLINMIEEYGNAYSRDREVLSRENAYVLLNDIVTLVEGKMNEFEVRAAKLTIAYLKVRGRN